jgi:hypothetical protein
VSRIAVFGSGAIGAIPLSEVGGVEVRQQTGYVIVDGTVQ